MPFYDVKIFLSVSDIQNYEYRVFSEIPSLFEHANTVMNCKRLRKKIETNL